MRLVSWNVNGLRAAIRKGIDGDRHLDADVLMLQERVCSRSNCPRTGRGLKATRFTFILQKEGLFGVATLSTLEQDVLPGFAWGEDATDIEGRVLVTRHGDLVCVNTYLPNGGGGPERQAYKERWMDAWRAWLAPWLDADTLWSWSETSTSPTPKTTSGTPKATPRRAVSFRKSGLVQRTAGRRLGRQLPAREGRRREDLPGGPTEATPELMTKDGASITSCATRLPPSESSPWTSSGKPGSRSATTRRASSTSPIDKRCFPCGCRGAPP